MTQIHLGQGLDILFSRKDILIDYPTENDYF